MTYNEYKAVHLRVHTEGTASGWCNFCGIPVPKKEVANDSIK